jgi:anti-anti-sigma factor
VITEELPLVRALNLQEQIPGMNVSCRTDRGYFVTSLRGALVAAVAPALREYLLRIVHESVGLLVIDLSAVTRADVNGLTVLVGAGRRASLLGGLLRLAAPAAGVAAALRTTGLDRQLHVYHSVEAAISNVASTR